MMKKSGELRAGIRAAREAGKILMDNYGRVSIKYKRDKTIVTDADIKSEKRIKEILKEDFPDYSFIAEESGVEQRNSEYTWIIDPLDGTTNYSIRNPFFNVSIALAKRDESIIGVVYYPFQDELFYAERGRGSFLNDGKIEVSTIDNIEQSVLTFCHAGDRKSTERMAGIWETLKLLNPKVRQIGAAALELGYVACGRVECFIMINLNLWDVAAGSLLVEEAGGEVTDLKGVKFNTNSKDILASNKMLHSELLRLING